MKVGRYLYEAEIPRATRATLEQLVIHEAAQGHDVYEERWVRNPLFDKPGQATTLAFRVRLIEGDAHARMVAERVRRILTIHPEWGVIRPRLAT